jgi:dihydrodipicolinate synthase/N-acetylneuraminate lyase
MWTARDWVGTAPGLRKQGLPNGSLGEYEALTDDERAGVVKTRVNAVGGPTMPDGAAMRVRAAVRAVPEAAG